MAQKRFVVQAVRRRSGPVATGEPYEVRLTAGGTLAYVSLTNGGAQVAGSIVTTDPAQGSLDFWGPTDDTDELYVRSVNDESLGWQRVIADPDARLDVIEAKLGSIGIDPETAPYNADGTGATNSYSALAAAVAAAQSQGRPLITRPGRTFRVDSSLTISAALTADFQGSNLKKGPSLNGKALIVSGADVVLAALVVDGNRAGGAQGGGISWSGARGKAVDCEVKNTKEDAWVVYSSGDLTAIRCVGSGNVTAASGVGTGKGFVVNTGAVLRTYDCQADDNDYVGFYVDPSAGEGCHLDGIARRNAHAGALIQQDNGTIGVLTVEDCNGFGTILTGVDSWQVGEIRARGIGAALAGFGLSLNEAGTAVEWYGVTNSQVGRITARDCQGYGLAMANDGATYCTGNQVAEVLGSGLSDPAVVFSTGAHHNHVGLVVAHGCTFAVNHGEGSATPHHNTTGLVIADNCLYGAVKWDDGNYNHIGRVIARNIVNSDPTNVAKAVLQFGVPAGTGAAVTGNTVGWLDYDHDDALGATKPIHLVHANALAVGNQVEGRLPASSMFQTSAFLDSGSGNICKLRSLTRGDIKRRTSDRIVNSTSWADFDTGLDITLPAMVGDKIEAAIDGLWNNEALWGYLDVATIVSGSPVTYFSTGTGTQAANGISGWRGVSGSYQPVVGTARLTLTAADLSGGQVTLRLRTKASAASTKTLFGSADSQITFAAQNLS